MRSRTASATVLALLGLVSMRAHAGESARERDEAGAARHGATDARAGVEPKREASEPKTGEREPKATEPKRVPEEPAPPEGGTAGRKAGPTPPQPLAPIMPTYPAEAARLGLAGDVVLILTVDETGAVTKVEVETGLGGGLTEAAEAAARTARFKPAMDADGRPMAVRIRWMARFSLPGTGARAALPSAGPAGTKGTSAELPRDPKTLSPRASAKSLPQDETPRAARASAESSPRDAATPSTTASAESLPQDGTPRAATAASAESLPRDAATPGTRASAESLPDTGPDARGIQKVPAGAPGRLVAGIREKGTGKWLEGGFLYIEDVAEVLYVDGSGRVERELAPGAYAVTVRAPGHVTEEHIERIRPGARLERTYFIERERLNQYETVVRARPPRAETGVVSLAGQELQSAAGTMGDPLKVVLLLPGVTTPMSGLPFPVVRGESPAATGTFVDDVRVPFLYHVGFGPAVIHPRFLESLDMHVGSFAPEHGRFTAGIVQAHTTGMPEERQSELSADLFRLSAFHTQPFTLAGRKAAVSAAARYATLAFLAQGINPSMVLEYWDYQLRGDLRVGPGALRLLWFGSGDSLGEKAHVNENTNEPIPESVLGVGFHRLDVRYRAAHKGLTAEAAIELGIDSTHIPQDEDPLGTVDTNDEVNSGGHLRELMARPRVILEKDLAPGLRLRTGGDALVQTWERRVPSLNEHIPANALTLGWFAQAQWQPTPRWLAVGGFRVDHYDNRYSEHRVSTTAFDPRLNVQWKARPGLALTGGVGVYQAPPRFLLPWPALEGLRLENGLTRSYQSSLGVALELPWQSSLAMTGYYTTAPRVNETTLNEVDRDDKSTFDPLGPVRRGRSVGLEIMARRRMGQRLFGWLTYSYGRNQRLYSGAGWRPSDFDQSHIINLVAAYALGRSWTVSGVFHLNSGRPATPCYRLQGNTDTPAPCFDAATGGQVSAHAMRNLDRLPTFWRLDLRIEKREAFDTWYLDFYIDWLNVSMRSEVGEYDYVLTQDGQYIRTQKRSTLTIPTMGLRATF